MDTPVTHVYVVEHFTDETVTEVYGVASTLDTAQALGEQCYGTTERWGDERDWRIDWREDASDTLGDGRPARSWAAHRPQRFGTARETYLFVHITEHELVDEV